MSATALDCSVSGDVLYMAMDLSTKKWGLAFSTGAAHDPRIREVPARDLVGLKREIRLAARRFEFPHDAPVVSCYKAGRDGLWIDRCLHRHGATETGPSTAFVRSSPNWKQSVAIASARKILRRPARCGSCWG